MTKKQGVVIQSNGGFYYVEAADAVYTCRARGIFRKQRITPMAGDRVVIALDEDGTGVLESVLKRRNCLVRPPVANIDLLVLVASVCQPKTNTLVLDKMIAVAEKKDITPIVVINKSDLGDPEELETIYRSAGLECFVVSAKDPASLDPLRQRLAGQISVFAGNSGVGKSSILNGIHLIFSFDLIAQSPQGFFFCKNSFHNDPPILDN